MSRLALAILVSIGLTRVPHAKEADVELQRLESFLSVDSDEDSSDDLADLQKAAVNAGPAALPLLRRLLPSPKESIRFKAAYALAFSGQVESADLLLGEFKRSQDLGIKTLTCFALARRGSRSDISFLIRALEGEQYGEEWPPIEAAALSLGVLRDHSAIAPLEVASRKERGSIAGGAAYEALLWTREGTYDVGSVSVGNELLPVLAVMKHGVPRIRESETFFESGARRLWRRQGRAWMLQVSETNSDKAPLISFETFISTDGKRAVVAVGLSFGRLNGLGYDYLLSNSGDGWRVIGILKTWIS